MFVEDARGIKRTAYPVRDDGPQFCSDCGLRLVKGMYYTRFTPYHPLTGKPGLMGIRCEGCYPFKEVERSPEDFDTPIRVSTPPLQSTSGDSGWLNSVPAPVRGSRWERKAPSHIPDVRTMHLGAVKVQTDPRLLKILKGVLSR